MYQRIIILGGDGFCGWPTALHLSKKGHDICIVDNLCRRAIDKELGTSSLTPISSIEERIMTWKKITGKNIQFELLDIAKDYDELISLLASYKPDAIVHCAEQRAAPYSMKSSFHKRFTVNNNINATHNLLAAITELDIDTHIIHIGTMGVYGYGTSKGKIPEGYLRIKTGEDHDLEEQEILHPTFPGSIYHMTKSLDQILFSYYNKNDNLRITDLHQGIIWGTQTEETKMDERLINRFDYDGDFGTVLNRFLMQSAIGHPLTVHGTGGQTRAFIHLQDSVRCIELALSSPPNLHERVRIINQVTETHNIKYLAELISNMTHTDISYVRNPRNEARENDLHVDNSTLLHLGLHPITLHDGLLEEIIAIARKYKHRCDTTKIQCTSLWNSSKK